MRVEIAILVRQPDGCECDYSYCAELPENMPIEQVEAHADSILKMLDKRATDTGADDGDEWKSEQKSPAP